MDLYHRYVTDICIPLYRGNTSCTAEIRKEKTYLIWGVWVAIFLIISAFIPPPHNWGPGFSILMFSLACLMHVSLYFITTTGRIGERFFLILSYAAFFTACCAITLVFQAFILPDSDWLYLVVYGVSLFLMLWLFLGKLLPIFRQSAAYIGREWHVLSAVMALFMVALMTWFVFPSNITDYTIKQIGGLPVLIIVMFVTYGVVFVCIRNIAAAEHAKQMELRLKLITTQAQTQASDEARRARHDLRHHNLALLVLAEQGNTAELVRYLRSVTEAEHAAETVWCENDTLSSILSVNGDIAPWAVGTTSAMVSAGYVKGYGGRINPTGYITRKDFAVLMDNVFKTYIRQSGTVTELESGSVIINCAGVTLKDATVNGDLVIGDGVGNGNVTFDNVKVTGRTVIRVGGVNSIVVCGESKLDSVIIAKVRGGVRVVFEASAAVKAVYVEDGIDDFILEGRMGALTIDSNTPVVLRSATADTVNIKAEGAAQRS